MYETTTLPGSEIDAVAIDGLPATPADVGSGIGELVNAEIGTAFYITQPRNETGQEGLSRLNGVDAASHWGTRLKSMHRPAIRSWASFFHSSSVAGVRGCVKDGSRDATACHSWVQREGGGRKQRECRARDMLRSRVHVARRT